MRKNNLPPPSILVTVQNFPPSIGGTAIIIHDLVQHFPPWSLYVVSGPLLNAKTSGQHLPQHQKRAYPFMFNDWLTIRFYRYFPKRYIQSIIHCARQIVEQYPIKRVYAHYPNALFTVAAYEVAKAYDLPLAVYFDILWEERGDQVKLAQQYEHEIVRYADMRFAITEYSVEHLSEKHGVPFVFLPHTCDVTDLEESICPVEDGAEPRIHFAGGIYSNMNEDSVLRLAQAIEVTRRPVNLELYGPYTKAVLTSKGFPTRRLRTGFVERAELRGIQSSSHILYLPQAFESQTPQMIRNNFPTKALEYMLARRPILLHSPRESYLTELARKHEFALIVDEPDVDQLAEAINTLLDNGRLQERLVRNAVEFARSRDARRWSSFFQNKLFGKCLKSVGEESAFQGFFACQYHCGTPPSFNS